MPGRIDRSVLSNFSGAVGSQIITALRFLNLIDEEKHPKKELEELVAAYGEDVWPDQLGAVLRGAYRPLFEIDLQSASPSQFTEKFRESYPAEGETLRKGITFFINAASDANIPISPYITKNKKQRAASPKRRATKASNGKTAPETTKNGGGLGGDNPPPPIKRTPSEVLLNLFDPSEMQQNEQDAIWTLIKYFKAKGQ